MIAIHWRFTMSGNKLVSVWWPITVTAKPKTSRPKQKHHGKNKIPHSKTKNLKAKTKYLTAKPNTSQQKQNSFGFAVGICFCREVFGQLLWRIWFCREGFGFAAMFLFLPWGFWFCYDSCGPPYFSVLYKRILKLKPSIDFFILYVKLCWARSKQKKWKYANIKN